MMEQYLFPWKVGVVMLITAVIFNTNATVVHLQVITYLTSTNSSKAFTQLTLTDEFGCEGVYTLTVDGPSRVDFQITDLVNQSCHTPNSSSDDGYVVVEVEGGVSPYKYKWTDMNSMISDSLVSSSPLTINGLTSSDWEVQVYDSNLL